MAAHGACALAALLVGWCHAIDPDGPGAGAWVLADPTLPSVQAIHAGVPRLWEEYPGRRCILIVHDGAIAYEGYAPGASPSERLEVDSAAKTINALLIGVLVTQGKLDLDTPLAKYNVTPHANWGQYWPLITARHLLTHTSGLGKGPPAQKFEYNSGEHIQHLSTLIGKLTSPPLGRWATPIAWAEEVFLKPVGLSGIFDDDGLDGEISMGGGQLLSCRQLARVGQLMLNRGRWPNEGWMWQLTGLWQWIWGGGGLQMVSEDYLDQMTRPSFPGVVSTYGFLLWLNRAPEPGDSSCCMCTCGVCISVPSPPILGTPSEDAWMATGYLTKYLIVLPQRRAIVVSLGMDMPGSQACSVAMSWASLTYDDTFGSLLHYDLLRTSLPRAVSTTSSTTTSTTTTTISTTITTSTTTTLAPGEAAAPSTVTTTTSTTSAPPTPTTTSTTSSSTLSQTRSWTTATSPPLAAGDNSSDNSTPAFDPYQHIYHGGYANRKPGQQRGNTSASAKKRRSSHGRQPAPWVKYMGGSCSCTCPVAEAFGRCFSLPDDLAFDSASEGAAACEHFSQGYEKLSELLGGSAGCYDVGLVQHCATNEWFMTSDLCGSRPWLDSYGLQCERRASCTNASDPPIASPTVGTMETCLCRTVRWKCDYYSEPCDPTDSYYPYTGPNISKILLKTHLALQPAKTVDHTPELRLAGLSLCAVALFLLGCGACWRCRRRRGPAAAGAYARMPE